MSSGRAVQPQVEDLAFALQVSPTKDPIPKLCSAGRSMNLILVAIATIDL